MRFGVRVLLIGAVFVVGVAVGFYCGAMWAARRALPETRSVSMPPDAPPLEVRSTECVVRFNRDGWNVKVNPIPEPVIQ